MRKLFTKSVFIALIAILSAWNLNAQNYKIVLASNIVSAGTVSGSGLYEFGTLVTVTATPANFYYEFSGWKEDGEWISFDPEYTFTVTKDRILIAYFNIAITSYEIIVFANPAAGGTVTGGGLYEFGTDATVTATAHPNYTFLYWANVEGQIYSYASIFHLIVTQDLTLVAHFGPAASFEVTVSANPAAGGTVTGGGLYEFGAVATVTATPYPGYLFVNWTEEGNIVSTLSDYTFPVTKPRNLVANFAPATCEITLSKNIEGVGTLHGAGTYNYGQMAIIYATDYLPEYMFANWTEDGTIVSNSSIVGAFPVTQSRHLVANFIPAFYEIHVYANPYEGGTVSGGEEYTYGASITLTATANDGYTFLNWTKFISGSGTVVSTEPDYTFVVTGEYAFVAYFEKESKVTVLVNVPGGEVLGGGVYHYGDEVTVEAIPHSGYIFVNWTEGRGIVSTDNPYSFIVTEDRTLVANFEEELFIEPIDPGVMMIYPNPTTGELRMDASAGSTTSGELIINKVEIFDLAGRKVYQQTINQSYGTLKLNELAQGAYILKVYLDQGDVVTWRVVKN